MRDEIRIAAQDAVGRRTPGHIFDILHAGGDGGEADHHEGDERQRDAGEAGAHLAPAHVVQAQHEGGADHAGAVDIRPFDLPFMLAQHFDGLLEAPADHQRDDDGEQEDEESEQDHQRRAHHVEGRMEGLQQQEDGRRR